MFKKISILTIFLLWSSISLADFQVFIDGKYFNENLGESNRWILWESSDPILNLGRQNIKDENKDLKLTIKIKNGSQQEYLSTSIYSCSNDMILLDGTGKRNQYAEAGQEYTLVIHFDPKLAGNKICQLKIKNSTFQFKGLAEDKGL